ncbi:hypothetical protein, partial, partial [Absidia glauca]
LFAFASIVVQQVGFSPGPQLAARSNNERDMVFTVNGTIYHKIGVSNTPNGRPRFSQVYFQDAEEQLLQRTSLIDHLNHETIDMLQTVIHQNNPFAQRLMTTYEQYGDQRIANVSLVIKANTGLGRRYDSPSYPEIAAMVMEDSIDGGIEPHDIVINDRTRGIQQVNSLNASYMPLHYVLMFPFGENGWDIRLHSSSGAHIKVTRRAYGAYMLMKLIGWRTTV